MEQLRTRDSPKSRATGNLTVDVPLSPRQAFAGGQMRILGAGPSDLSGMQWERECRTLPMLAL